MSRHVAFRAFRSDRDFADGTHQGTQARAGRLGYGAPAGLLRLTDPRPDGAARGYEWAAWAAPQVTPGFDFTSLVASWNATTPADSWLHVEVRVSVDGVRWSRWYSMGVWAETDAEVRRASRTGQQGDAGRVAIDVLDATPGASWSAYQLRVVLARRPGSTAVPSVRLLGAMVSRLPADPGETSRPTAATGTELPVPRYSQQLHRGSHPEWANGGESWCSPSSTAMVLDHWGVGPGPEDYGWVPRSSPNPAVVHAVRNVFDYGYGGAGNWSFNAAYAARFGVVAFVTRLRSLVEAEHLVAAGIPVVASVAFDEQELTGAGYKTDGHLLTITGFTATGDVVCNDPASHELPSNDEVRVVYDRAEFERVWLGSAGGAVYVIHPDGVPLPPPAVPAEPNW
jgi:hypothetical protein